jgi:hypothetical protein
MYERHQRCHRSKGTQDGERHCPATSTVHCEQRPQLDGDLCESQYASIHPAKLKEMGVLPSYLAIIACVACLSKSISFPAMAVGSLVGLPVFSSRRGWRSWVSWWRRIYGRGDSSLDEQTSRPSTGYFRYKRYLACVEGSRRIAVARTVGE